MLITAALRAAYPDAMILGEETYAGKQGLMQEFWAADHAFTVDPVDGTKNFVHGSRDHAVMVGEVKGGEAVRGWIWQPQHEQGVRRGAGRRRVAQRRARGAAGDAPALGVARASRRAGSGSAGRSRTTFRPLELTWVSCGIDYPHLAEGDADYVVYGRANPWDHVPGGLILTEAGGFLGTFDGGAYRPTDDHDVDGAAPRGLVAAGDRATYEAIRPLDLEPADSHRPIAHGRGRLEQRGWTAGVSGHRYRVTPG